MNTILDQRLIATFILLVTVSALCGCVRRRLTVRSNPPGAVVYVDNQQIGTTPVSKNFTYYGTRTITLVKDGYETLTVKQDIDAPWYQCPPLDFFSENVNPNEIRDERVLDFTLQPQQMVPPEMLLQSAESLRANAQQGYVAPLPGSAASPVVQPDGVVVPYAPQNSPAQPLPYPPLGSATTRGPWR